MSEGEGKLQTKTLTTSWEVAEEFSQIMNKRAEVLKVRPNGETEKKKMKACETPTGGF